MVLSKIREVFRPRHRLTPEEYLAKLTARGLHPDGTQILDPVPLAPPIGYKKTPSMVEIVRDMIRSERLAAEAAAMGHETFEESEDFDVGDEDPLMRSPWENDFDPPLETLLQAGREELARRRSAEAQQGGAELPTESGGAKPPKPPKKPPVEAPEAPDEP